MRRRMLTMMFGFMLSMATAGADLRAEESNKAFIRQVMQDVFVNKDLSAIDRYYDPSYRQHNPNVADGPAAMKSFFQNFFMSFPDYAPQIDMIMAEDDLVMVFLTWRGTHTGTPFQGVPARGASVIVKTADIFRIRNGKIVEHWDVVDQSGRDEPLGLVVRRPSRETAQ